MQTAFYELTLKPDENAFSCQRAGFFFFVEINALINASCLFNISDRFRPAQALLPINYLNVFMTVRNEAL